MESKPVSTDVADKINQSSPVSRITGIEEEKGYISTGSNDQPTKRSTEPQQPRIELSSASRTTPDDIVREIIVLDKETGSKYKVITMRFPHEDEAVATKDADTSVQIPDKPEAAVQSSDEKSREHQEAKDAVDAEEEEVAQKTKSNEKDSAKKDKKGDTRQVEQNRKSEKNDKKKNKDEIEKENEKKSTDKSNSKQDKKRTKRDVEGQKSLKGKGKHSSKNREGKKYKAKGKY